MDFDYQRYLASRQWAVLRQQVIDRADGGTTCERCLGSRRDLGVIVAAVHHRTYARIGHERLEDLLGLCQGCHRYLSGRSTSDPLRDLLEHDASPGDSFGQAMLAALIADPNRTWRECHEVAEAAA